MDLHGPMPKPPSRIYHAASTAFFLAGLCAVTGCETASRHQWLGLTTDFAPEVLRPHLSASPRPDTGRNTDLQILRELQVPMIRDLGMSWAAIQPEANGKFDFKASDDLARQAQILNANLLVVFTGVPAWAAASPGEGNLSFGVPHRDQAQAFEQFVRAYVERYSPRRGAQPPIHAIEFLQDIEKTPTSEYAFWLKRLYIAVKRVDPSILVVLGGLRSPGIRIPDEPAGDYPGYFQRLLAEDELAGERYPYFDVVAFQHYPRRYPGREAFSDAYAYLQKCMGERSIHLPIWVTAFGGGSDGGLEALQAGDLVKWAIHGRAIGIERLYLYALRDAAVGEKYGLLRQTEPGKQPSRKPAYQAVQTLLRRINKQPMVTPRGQGIYMLTGEGEPTYVLWDVETHDPVSFLISGWWEVQTLSGQRAARQGSEVKRSTTPIFIQRTKSPFIY